jgi:bla regulator protein BlaR1
MIAAGFDYLWDHLWQSTVFVAAAAALAFALRKNGAHVRHWIWLTASVKFLVPLSLVMSLGALLPQYTPVAIARTSTALPELSVAVEQITQPFSSGAFVAETGARPGGTRWTPWLIGGIWAVGFVTVVAMRLRGWQRVRAALRTSAAVAVDSSVPVRSSPGLLEPGVVGIWRPVLLIPEGIREQLTPRQFEAVLLHESCHIRRRDNLTSALHMVVEAAFWFHPLVWFVGARMVDERERACDEFVLRSSGDPTTYAESILNVCKLYVESPVACVSGVTGSDLKKRVAAIMGNRTGANLNAARRAALVCAGVAAFALPLAAGMVTSGSVPAQSAAPAPGQSFAKFDVVSVKPCAGDTPGLARATTGGGGGRSGGGSPITSPGRLYLQCFNLSGMITEAYVFFANGRPNGISSTRSVLVEGVPDWARTERFLIEATTASNVPAAVMRGPMLQAILEDRFKLKTRRETREVPVYELVAARSGAKVSPYTGDECVIRDEAVWPPPQPPEGKRFCGDRSRVEGDDFIREGVMKLDDLAALFAFDRPVVNKTGITAPVSYRYQYGKSDVRADGAPPPSFVGELRDKLGLELREGMGPREFLIIESVQRPSPDPPLTDRSLRDQAALRTDQGALREPR